MNEESESPAVTKTIQEIYIDSLSPKERIGYDIAREQLGNVFSLEKSIGYRNFLKSIAPPPLTKNTDKVIT